MLSVDASEIQWLFVPRRPLERQPGRAGRMSRPAVQSVAHLLGLGGRGVVACKVTSRVLISGNRLHERAGEVH